MISLLPVTEISVTDNLIDAYTTGYSISCFRNFERCSRYIVAQSRQSFIHFPANMSLLQRMFGGKNKENIPVTEDAIQKLKNTEEMLEKKQEYLEKKIDAENATAKKYAKTNKRLALQALKRRKRLEKQLNQIDGTLSTIEFQRENLENAGTNTEVLKNMKFAADALKNVHRSLDVEDVHDMMDDIHEQTEISTEISEAICGVGANRDFDDDELRAELEAIEREVLDDELVGIEHPAGGLPDVPPGAPATKKKAVQNENDLKELEA